MDKILKSLFYISALFLIIISLWPGSLLGFLFYGDLAQQPDLFKNPFGTTINHFIYYAYVSLLGFFLYSKYFVRVELRLNYSFCIKYNTNHYNCCILNV